MGLWTGVQTILMNNRSTATLGLVTLLIYVAWIVPFFLVWWPYAILWAAVISVPLLAIGAIIWVEVEKRVDR